MASAMLPPSRDELAAASATGYRRHGDGGRRGQRRDEKKKKQQRNIADHERNEQGEVEKSDQRQAGCVIKLELEIKEPLTLTLTLSSVSYLTGHTYPPERGSQSSLVWLQSIHKDKHLSSVTHLTVNYALNTTLPRVKMSHPHAVPKQAVWPQSTS